MPMSRPMVLVLLLVMLIITSQFEWKQQLVNVTDASPVLAQKQHQQRIASREEAVKERIILSQEKRIQRLNDLVQSLQQQLLQCGCSNITVNISEDSLTDFETQEVVGH